MPEFEPRHVKSTSMAEYFVVPNDKGMVTVRQSNLNGVICCLTCLTIRCAHVSAALPVIEMHGIAAVARQSASQSSGAESAEEHVAA